jgi:hypothetical protein
MTEHKGDRRPANLEWEEMALDYAAIERRAQQMRAEAAWGIARAVREWAAGKFGNAATKTREATRPPFAGHGQPT